MSEEKTPNAPRVTVEVENVDPWAVVAAFKLASEMAKSHGLPDVEDINCSLNVTFYGFKATPEDAERFASTLKSMWLHAHVEKEEDHAKS